MNSTNVLIIAGLSLFAGAVIGYLAALARRTAALQKLGEERARAVQQAERVPSLEAKFEELSRENTRLCARIAELDQLQEAEKEKTGWLKSAEAHLREAFEALASKALHTNAEEFASRTKEQFVVPLEKSLKDLDGHVRELERKREGAYRSLDEHVLSLKGAYEQLRNTTSDLATALTTSSGSRGQWGEVQLRRIVELAGMVPHVDFEEQERHDSGQPDMLVHLPNDVILPVDAKTTLKTYLAVMDAEDDNTRKAKLVAHANAVKTRVRELASREYWKNFEHTPDFVVMFVPNDAFLSAAFEGDRDLFEYAFDLRVLITTPVTLLALLRTVAYAWQQQRMADSAREIAGQARELSSRIGTFIEHMRKTGKGLDTAVRSYNEAVGSLESRVLPSVRRFKELGVTAEDPQTVEPVDLQARLPAGNE